MSTKLGQEAETLAANYLVQQGLKITMRNYRDRWCEIDIIARRKDTVHFVEVKFRQSGTAGAGVEYITPDKIRRLKNGASNWMAVNYPSDQYQIDVISVDGKDITYIPNAIQG